MEIPLDEVIYFDCITSDPETGDVSDADSTPTFEVFEEATDTDIGVGGNLTKRTSKTGNYRGTFTLSAANGFEVGKWYNVIASATVNSIAGKDVVKTFRVVLAESIAGARKGDVHALVGVAQSATDLKDFADDGYDPSTNKVQGVVLVDTLTTYTGNTPQTGDSYAIVNSGTHGNAAIKTETAAIKAKTDNLPSDPADASVIAGRFDTLDTSIADLPTNAELATALGTADDAVLAQVALVKAKTDNLPSDPADQSIIIAATDALVALIGDVPTVAEFEARTLVAANYFDPAADTVANVTTVATLTGHTPQTGDAYAALTSAVPDSVPADGSRPTVQQAVRMILNALIEGGISGTTWTIKKEDGSTTLFTVTLDDDTTPTSKTRSG